MPAKGQKAKQSVRDYLSEKYKADGNPNWKGGTSKIILKGRRAWNKGTKGLTSANKTSFKKGMIPKNYNGGLSFYGGRWIIVCRGDKKFPYARAVMCAHLKRQLTPQEIVHHINEDTTDDRIENLQIVTRGQHVNIHRTKLLEARKWHYEHKNQK